MKTLTFTQEFMEQKEDSTPTYTTSQFTPPLPDKIEPIEFNQVNPSPPPPPLTISSLQKHLQPLLKAARVKKQEWITRYEYLNHRLKALEKLAQISQLGEAHLNAYLLNKSAHYANYQTNQLKTNFTLQTYLQTLAAEIAAEAKHISRQKEASQ